VPRATHIIICGTATAGPICCRNCAALNFRELSAPPNSEAWAAAWRPYVEPCIELFGAERCNFESNFPVDKMGTGYATLWNAFKRITAGFSQTEKLALYSGTARRLRRLD